MNKMFERSATLRKSNDRLHDRIQSITFTPRTKIEPMIESLENVFEMTYSLATKFQNQLQISEDREVLRAGFVSLRSKIYRDCPEENEINKRAI